MDETSDVLFDSGAADGCSLVFRNPVLNHGIGICHVNVDEVVLFKMFSVLCV